MLRGGILAGLLCALLAASAAAQYAQRPAPTAPPVRAAEKIELDGLPSLGRVSETLYRGAQPKPEGYPQLKALGIEVVVNFRDEKDKIEQERRAVEAQGMRYVSLPWKARQSPKTSAVAAFLKLLRADPEKKIFVHCKRGQDRTGVMLATYRIAAQKWTPQQALEEMEAFGFHGLWFRHLKHYVREFPQLLRSDPSLRDFLPVPRSAPEEPHLRQLLVVSLLPELRHAIQLQ